MVNTVRVSSSPTFSRKMENLKPNMQMGGVNYALVQETDAIQKYSAFELLELGGSGRACPTLPCEAVGLGSSLTAGEGGHTGNTE